MARTVELQLAYSWVCPICEMENFVKPADAELTPEEERALHAELGEPILGEHDPEQGQWVCMPKEVKCFSCARNFETIDPRDADSLDFEDEGADE